MVFDAGGRPGINMVVRGKKEGSWIVADLKDTSADTEGLEKG